MKPLLPSSLVLGAAPSSEQPEGLNRSVLLPFGKSQFRQVTSDGDPDGGVQSVVLPAIMLAAGLDLP